MTTYPLESTNHPNAHLDLIYFDAGGGHRASATSADIGGSSNSIVRGRSIRSTCAICSNRPT